MSTTRYPSAKKYWRVLTFALCTFGGVQTDMLFAQEVQAIHETDGQTAQVQSTIRRAKTPSTRFQTVSNRQQLRVTVEGEEAAAAGEVKPASPAHSGAVAGTEKAESVQAIEYYDDSGSQVVSEGSLANDWSFESGSCGCGDGSCDGMCGSSICNPASSCGFGPCISFANPLVDPAGFGCSILNRMQFRVTSVQFWKTDAVLPVLATTATNPDSATAGQFGSPVLFGGSPLQGGAESGMRGEFTFWLDPVRERALWLRLYDSGDQVSSGNFDSDRTSFIARPFRRVDGTNALVNDTLLIARPNGTAGALREGSLDISLKSSIEGGDLLMRRRICEDDLVRSDFLWGYQQARFTESLAINTRINTAPGLALTEYFDVANQFNGGQVGYLRSAHDGCWYFDGFAKIGFGKMKRRTYIDDSNTGGLLANQETNVGTYTSDTFVLVPELGVSAAYLLTDNLHFTVGYSFMRLPKVTRVEDALDPGLVVDTANPPTTLRPAFFFQESNFDVHMLDLGLQYRY